MHQKKYKYELDKGTSNNLESKILVWKVLGKNDVILSSLIWTVNIWEE